MIEKKTSKFSRKTIKIVGCGLAGAEVAFILANNGFDVHIFDNGANSPKEKFDYYDKYASYLIENMQFELDCLDSPIFSMAKNVGFKDFGFIYDRNFMNFVKKELIKHSNIKVFNAKIETLTDTETTVIATGHKTDKALLTELEQFIGKNHICYFEPINLVIDANSLDLTKLHFTSKVDCFVNLSENEYLNFYKTIIDFDKNYQYPQELEVERRLTAESYAQRGEGGLRNAFMRPCFDKNCQEKPYASLKMKYDKLNSVLIVSDFFSALTEQEQDEVLKTIDVLKGCKILRYSCIKRKTYLLAPTCINNKLQIKGTETFYVCGGFVGTAGSFESLLMANFCAYQIISQFNGNNSVDILQQNTCIAIILEILLKKSVINYRLFNLKYDIINEEDLDKQSLSKYIEIQKYLSKSQIEKFKEKFYGNKF